MFKHQRKQVGNDQNADPFVDGLVIVARNVGIEQPRVKPLAKWQIAVNLRFFFLAKDGVDVEVFDEFAFGFFHVLDLRNQIR